MSATTAPAAPFRLPRYRDAASGRVVPLRSSSYTVMRVVDGLRVSKAGTWAKLGEARRAARLLAASPLGGPMLVVRPAGLIDDDDHYEEIQ